MTRVSEIEGIGVKLAGALREQGIRTTDALLQASSTRAAREALGTKIGVSAERVLEWANRADLMRLKGVGSELSDLLEAAGVDTVKELARRRADNLQVALREINVSKKLVRRVPRQERLDSWIAQAKKLVDSSDKS